VLFAKDAGFLSFGKPTFSFFFKERKGGLMHKYKIFFGAAILAAVSILLQVYKVAYPVGGVIDIDLVGIPWVVSTFLFGLTGGLLTSCVSAIGIMIYAPTGWIGALMKFLATIIVVIIVGAIGAKFGYGKKSLVIAFIAALVARPVLMVLFNYYIGIPLFFGLPVETAMEKFPVWILAAPNAILAITDFWIAYLLVFSTRLKARLND
jgi:riboflavin transporter FmnP